VAVQLLGKGAFGSCFEAKFWMELDLGVKFYEGFDPHSPRNLPLWLERTPLYLM